MAATKIVKLYYNGEHGWNRTIQSVHEFFQIQQPIREWLDSKDDDGVTNASKIILAWDVNTAVRAQYRNRIANGDVEWNETKDWENGSDLDFNFPMSWPIQLHVEASKITRDLLLDQSNFVSVKESGSNFNSPLEDAREDGFTFTADIYSRYLTLLMSDSAYEEQDVNIFSQAALGQYNTERPYESNPEYEIAYKINPKITVWVWPKALNEQTFIQNGAKKPFNKQTLFNLTPFLQSATTNVVKSGGSFALTLAPIVGAMSCAYDERGQQYTGAGTWYPDPQHYEIWKEQQVDNFLFKSPINVPNHREADTGDDSQEPTVGKRFQNQKYDNSVRLRDRFESSDIGERFEGEWKRQDFFFTNLLSENDIIFISFTEDCQPAEGYTNDFFMSVDEIQGHYWDMIGLIDSNSTSLNAEATDVSINIAGRDLMKLLIEDGSFFFQKSYANPDQKETAFNNTDLPKQGDDTNALNIVLEQKDVNSANRLITTGMIATLFNQEARNVGFIMNLLVSQLANIEICPSQVFEGYGDRRTKFQVEVLEQSEENTDGKENKTKETGL